ncbi:hypothetical protein [Roseateles sp. LYH14W]|uniref:Uncharacterized protein n=1 Tax=Pelomonas parva TaxID=3299032 RepID=A0ABW7FAE1_9BURK
MNVFPSLILLLPPAIVALAIVFIMLDTVWFPEARRDAADDATASRSPVQRVPNVVKRVLAWLLFLPSVLFLVFVVILFVASLWRSF